jgi:hypothetical protein
MSAVPKIMDAMDGMDLMDAAGEALTAREWAELLGLTVRSVQLAMERVQAETRFVKGGLAKVFRFADLPEFYRAKLETLRAKHAASCYGSLLSMRHVETRWVPPKPWMEYPESTRAHALRRKAVMQVYFAALDAGREKQQANLLAQAEWLKQFGEACDERTIRRLEDLVEARGGIDFIPDEGYCHGKSTPHHAARLKQKLGIPDALIAEFKALTLETEHISSAHRDLEIRWVNGEEVPGLGRREGNARFPYKLGQLRRFAASTPARRQQSHGKARARREALPSIRTSSANLQSAELYVLDDSRLNVVCTDDDTGDQIECRLYFLMDVGPRKIVAWVLRPMGRILASDVATLLARGLRAGGIAAPGAGYVTRILFERGTVACSPDMEAFLLGAFPGRLQIERTGMDGGKNHAGDFTQRGSGHWMGKAHIESFMRTAAFFMEHVPGQRGGTREMQPASLGLKGFDRETNTAQYTLGSRIHEAALLTYADKAAEMIDPESERLKVSALWPLSWIQHALTQAVAYYNARTDHRMEGFSRIEYQDEATGALKHRMESPNERAAKLERLNPTQRISASDAAFMLSHAAKPVTMRAAGVKAGVSMDLAPWRGLRFWREDSLAFLQAAKLATLEKKFTAIYDEEAIRLWQPGCGYTPELHLLTEMPGQKGSRYLETLPLDSYGDRTDPDSMASASAQTKKAQNRIAREILRAATPTLAEKLAEQRHNTGVLRGTAAVIDQMRATAAPSALITDIRTGRAVVCEGGEPTRSGQMDGAAAELARFQAEHLPRATGAGEEAEPEIF